MPAEVILAGRAAAGLEVDDHRPALVIPLEPVDPPGDLHRPDLDLQRLLDGDELRGLAACQARNLRTIFSACSRCLTLYQTLPKSRWGQMSSMRLLISVSEAPPAASTAAAWITVPRCRSTSDQPAPAADSSSQRSPHRVNAST